MNPQIVAASIPSPLKKPVAIVGADLDVSLVRNLQAGDTVLVEMNGTRIYASPDTAAVSPLAADGVWTVISNTEKSLSLRHPLIGKDLELPYAHLHGSRSPALFVTENLAYCPNGPIFVLLQFVSHYLSLDAVSEAFPNPFNPDQCLVALEDDRVKVGLMERWTVLLKTFRPTGFGYKSIKRLSLLSGVSEKDLLAIRDEDWASMFIMSDEKLVALQRALSWLPHFIRQATLILHDATTEFDPEGKDSSACPNSADGR